MDAAAKGPGPFSTLSPYEEKYIDIRQNGLCYYKTTAVNIWDDPEKMGFEYDDPVYQLIAFEQEFDEKGNAKYTDKQSFICRTLRNQKSSYKGEV